MKKNLLLALSFLTMSATLSAQNFVSTTHENRNVVLEEFTGIYCGYCPSGHLIASNFQAANPNDVFLINIHAGSYAQPNPSESNSDFRTIFGMPLVQQANVQGFPAGTINRQNFPGLEQEDGNGPVAGITAMSRNNWVTTGNIIMGDSSPVNVAAQATIDLQTRELKVIVETYFTSAAGTAPYKLNVALLQNNVEGPQSSGSDNPDAILPNGNYNHQHMLRNLLTGQGGIDVTATTAGYFQADTIVYTIPTGIAYQTATAIATNLINMEVVVFIAEGAESIVTGNRATMNYLTPPGTSTASVTIAPNSTITNQLCDYSYTPAVDVSNNSTSGSSIDSFLVSYSVNGGVPVTQLVTTPLTANSTTTINFAPTQLGAGQNNIVYEIDFESYNYLLLDISPVNDKSVIDGPHTKLPLTVNSDSIVEGFEGLAVGTATPNGAIAHNPDNIRAFSVDESITSAVTWNLGGHGASQGSFRWDFYSIAEGKASKLIWEKLDLTNKLNSKLSFSRAHSLYDGTETDRLKVNVSTDCGDTWTTVWDKQGTQLATKAPTTNNFYPLASEWITDTVDLTTYDGASELVIAFEGISGYGNGLYVDDINTFESSFIGVSTINAETAEVRIMPNPVSNQMTLEFTILNTADANINIVNTLGQEVQQVTNGSFSGTNVIDVNTSQLVSGIYFVNITTKSGTTTKRFVRQ